METLESSPLSISSFKIAHMKKLLIKLFLFLIPFYILFGIPISVLLFSGELTSLDRIIEIQKDNEIQAIYGPAYSNNVYYYKLKSAISRNKLDVLVLGTSRVMQFRSPFFKNDVSFYNAGGGVAKLDHFRHFIKKIPKGKEPEIIIMGIDNNFFNNGWCKFWDNFHSKKFDIAKELESDIERINIIKSSWKMVYSDYFKKNYSLSKVFLNSNKLQTRGLTAVINLTGFRNDGSQYNARYINDLSFRKEWDYQFEHSYDCIKTGRGYFCYGKELSKSAINELKSFLKYCNNRGIYVIGFLPPYAHEIYKKLQSLPDKYEYMFKVEPTLRPIFDYFGYGFYNFSDLATIGATDSETFDGWHGTEKAYLRLFIKMAEDNRILKQYTDVPYLKVRLKTSNSNYEVFTDLY